MKISAYEINDGTYAIYANNQSGSKILEENETYEIEQNPSRIIDYGCNYFGSSYKGRRDGSILILNSRYKVPIVIEDSQNMIFFPTGNKDDIHCSWIALNKVKSYAPCGKKTRVEFLNGKTLTFDVSFRSFQNQVLRASRLDSIITNRKRKSGPYEKKD